MIFRDENYFSNYNIFGRIDTMFFLGALHDKILINKEITNEIIGNFLWLKNNYLNIEENKNIFINGSRYKTTNKEFNIIQLSNFIKQANKLLEINNIQPTFIQNLNEQEYKELKDEEIYNELEQIKKQSLLNNNKSYGIYGIYVNNNLVYIGETCDSFINRFKSHKRHIENNDIESSQKIYLYLKECKKNNAKIQLIPLIDITKLQTKNKKSFTENDIKCMELALITYLQPKLNIEGVSIPYTF